MEIRDNLLKLQAAIPDSVKLVAVSKFHPASAIQAAYDVGQRIFGENRVQELVAKQPLLPDDVEWHFIGNLQTNKVRYIAPFVSMIQSVDSVKLMQEIDRQAGKWNRNIRLLIEVHIAEEATKHGFSPDECKMFFADDLPAQFKHVKICGLMGMATFTDDMEQVKREFGTLRALFEEIRTMSFANKDFFTELSTGMSDDYQIAIEEGSTMIRIGTAIFGARK